MVDRRSLAILGIVFALGFPALPISAVYDEFADVAHLVGYELIWWAATLLILIHVRFVEQQPLATIGVRRPSARDLAIATGAGVAILVVLAALYNAVLPSLQATEGAAIAQLMATPVWWRVISTVRAAVGEEVLFRGYALERLAAVTRRPGLAAAVSWAAFTVEHVGFWGWGHLLVAGIAGALLTGLYLWRRNLWVNILAHFIVDAAALLAG
jgi:membrane protease YdiL (CAAX protease family)